MAIRLIAAMLCALLLAACVEEPSAARPTSGPAGGLTEQPPAAGLPAGYPPLPAGLLSAPVLRVVDGDTLDVEIDGERERVRLIGINTPETVDPRRPVECYGKEASTNAKALLEGQRVLLEEDESQGSRDPNGRLLRYVWLEDGRMVNLEQIGAGFAFEYTYDTPYRYRDEFRAAERAARAAGAGLWAPDTCNGQSIPADEEPAPEAPPAASCGDRARPEEAAEAPVRVVGLDKRGELVELENVSGETVSLEGWRLCSLRGGEEHPGVGGELAPGERRAFANPGEAIWSNGQPDDAALYDADGNLVSFWPDE